MGHETMIDRSGCRSRSATPGSTLACGTAWSNCATAVRYSGVSNSRCANDGTCSVLAIAPVSVQPDARRSAGRYTSWSATAGVAKLVRRGRLKPGCPSGHGGSTPSPGTSTRLRRRLGAAGQERVHRELLRTLELVGGEERIEGVLVERRALREIARAVVRLVLAGRDPGSQ